MIPRMRRVTAIAATSALLATLTACTDKGTPKPSPTPVSLSQATKTLATDGQKIAGLMGATADQIDDRTSTDNPEGCPSGTARTTFTIKIADKLGQDVHKELVSAIAYADERVEMAGYQRIRHASREDEMGGEVLFTTYRKPTAKVGFTVTVWTSGAESVRSIAGRTDCLR